jgi:hydroxymethylbilane synthase
MFRKIILGSRGSELALWQANFTKTQLEKLGYSVEIIIIKTKGDQIQHLSFDKIEGKGFFTKELEEALLDGTIDLAVHSHKDLPTTFPEGLTIAAVSYREDCSESILISPEALNLNEHLGLKKGAIVGTSSARRKSQLLNIRPDLIIKDLRGNVPTRINKLRDKMYDAIVLASAGLNRLNIDLEDIHRNIVPPTTFIPAPAQGVLAFQIRESDEEMREIILQINDALVAKSIAIERKVLNRMDGGCLLPLGVYCLFEEDKKVAFSCSNSLAFNGSCRAISSSSLCSGAMVPSNAWSIHKVNSGHSSSILSVCLASKFMSSWGKIQFVSSWISA